MTNPKPKSFLSIAIAKSRTNSELSTSSDEAELSSIILSQQAEDKQRLEAEHQGWKEIHGFRGNGNWNSPIRLNREANQTFGPAAMNSKHHCYEDEPYVFHQKIKLLAQLIVESRRCCVCSGKDLATETVPAATPPSGSVPSRAPLKTVTREHKVPTATHYALAALHRHGLVHHWIQQHHDALPQQGGFPQEALNEIHGSKYDPSNPVVQRGGTLRTDLFEDLLRWEEAADLSLCFGPSRGGGLRSDRVFRTVARRGRQGLAIGGVIIGLHKTPDDHFAALKIYARSEHVMEALLRQLRIRLPPPGVCEEACRLPRLPRECLTARSDVFRLPYDCNGNRLLQHCTHAVLSGPNDGNDLSDEYCEKCDVRYQQYTTLDLQEGSTVVIRTGPFQGCTGEVMGKTAHGHYRICFSVMPLPSLKSDTERCHVDDGRPRSSSCEGNSSSNPPERGGRWRTASEGGSGGWFEGVLGLWWLESAARGALSALPITSPPCPPPRAGLTD